MALLMYTDCVTVLVHTFGDSIHSSDEKQVTMGENVAIRISRTRFGRCA